MTISDNIDTQSGLLFEAPSTTSYRAAATAGRGVASDVASKIELTVHSEFDDVSAVWRTFEETADCTAFQTFVWHATWQRHVGSISGVLPAIVVGREEGRVLFIAPLAVERGLATRRLVWHAWQLCDYNAPLLAPGFAERVPDERFAALWQDVLRLLKRDPRFAHDVVMLHKMPGAVAGLRNPFTSLPVTPHASSAYAMALGTDWEIFYKEKRSSSTRRHARAKLKNLGEIGSVEFATAGVPGDVTAVLETLFHQKAASFARMGVVNFLLRSGYQDFYRAVASAPENRSLVHVSQLLVGEATSAANLGMVFRGRYYHVLASHGGGPAIERFGPGTAHLHMLIAYAIERGCHTFDFTIGDESYKREWCEQHTALWDLCHPASARGTIMFAALFAGMNVKRFIKHSEPLWNFYKRARRALASVRGAGRAVQSEAPSDDG
jgi:CelD/BcsL family acetyltransferase involved in cellulose biosynthesis